MIVGLYLTEHSLPELEDTFGPSLPLLNLNHNQLYILVAGVMPLSEIVTDTSRKRFVCLFLFPLHLSYATLACINYLILNSM